MADSDGLVPVRIYQKRTDSTNTRIFAIVEVDGTQTEVEVDITVPE
jgi:hypothetical protein